MGEIEQVLEAINASALFGKNENRAKITYRRLARCIHPDMFSDPAEKSHAQKAFQHLSMLWESYLRGNGSTTPGKSTGAKPNTVKTSRREYRLDGEIQGDPFFTRFEANYDDGHEKVTILIVSDAADNDLMDNHIETVRFLNKEVPEQYRGFYPDVLEMFQHKANGQMHRAVVQTHHEGLVPFNRILARYPEGISGRDVAWIFRRMLVAVGNAHDQGVVNGGVNMDSFFIQPEKHGVTLSDWQYSARIGKKLTAVPPKWKSDYPERFLKGEPVTHSLDIALCGKVAARLLGAGEPRRLHNFFKVCQTTKLEASVLLREFDILLENLYGKPKFHPFTLDS